MIGGRVVAVGIKSDNRCEHHAQLAEFLSAQLLATLAALC